MGTDEALHILKDCEGQLQELLRNAAARGDYDSLMQVTAIARQVSILIEQAQHPSTDSSGNAQSRSPSTGHGGSCDTPKPVSPAPRPSTKRARGRKRQKRESEYPKFLKDGNGLLKLGWSKREKKEYRHRAPRLVVDLLATKLAEVAKGGTFTTENLFPLLEEDGTEVSSYQAYLCLAWLRKAGLVAQQGRQGYTVADPDELPEAVEEAWGTLPRA